MTTSTSTPAQSPALLLEAFILLAVAYKSRAAFAALAAALAAYVALGAVGALDASPLVPAPLVRLVNAHPPATVRAVASRPWAHARPFQVVEVPEPRVAAGHVVVEVHGVGANPVDKYRALAAWVPFVRWVAPEPQMQDYSGVVAETGCPDQLPKGTAVMGISLAGAFVEKLSARCSAVARKPAALSHARAATLPTVGLTGIAALRGRVTSSTGLVLVVGASSGCGQFGVKYARKLGAVRVACVVSRSKFDRAVRTGCDADLLFDYTSPDFARDVAARLGGKVDVVYDTVSFVALDDYYPALHATLKARPAPAGRDEHTYVATNAGQYSDYLRKIASVVTGMDWEKANYSLIMEPLTSYAELERVAVDTAPDVGRTYSGFDVSGVNETLSVVGKHPGGRIVFSLR